MVIETAYNIYIDKIWEASKTAMERLREIVLWGDSIMRGVVYDEAKQKYSLASPNGAEAASRVLGLPLRMRARRGCTVDNGLTLIQKYLKTEKEAGEGIEAALLEFGGNDCDFNWGQVAADPEARHQPRTPLDRFSVHLEEMIRLVRSHGMRPVLVTLPPVHAERYLTFICRPSRDREGLNRDRILSFLGDVQFIYRWHERYNNSVVRMATEAGCLVADVRSAFLEERHYEDRLCADGIHPNEKGYTLIEQSVEELGFQCRARGSIS